MTVNDYPRVPFSIGMTAANGSPPFAVLMFDDGAAVPLHAVRGLANDLGLPLPSGDLFALLQAWPQAFPALSEVVQALAYDDRARGYRGNFVPADLFDIERLVPEARQIFRIQGDEVSVLPATVQGGAHATLSLDERAREAVPSFAMAAVIGAMCRNADPQTAALSVAGWSLTVELIHPGESGLKALAGPGATLIGPALVPAAFASELSEGRYRFAAMGRVLEEGAISHRWSGAAERIAALSQDVLLLPGDVVIFAEPPSEQAPAAGSVDVIEATAPGFGQIKVSLK